MSKLSSLIEATPTGRIQLGQDPTSLFSLKEDVAYSDPKYGGLIEYRVGVRYGAEVRVKNSNELIRAKDNVKRSIIREVFGEFHDPILRLERFILARDFDAARVLIREIENEMFS